MDKIIKVKVQEIRFFYKIIFYVLFGLLWSFSNIGYSLGFLTWFAFVPFLFSIKYETFKLGILFSWIFGVSVYFFHFWWMINPFISFFSMNSPFYANIVLGFAIGWLATLCASVYHGIMYALIYIIAKYIVSKKRGSFFYLVMPFVVPVVDYFFPKLWYDQIGYSQYIFFNFSQIADLFGIPFITFIVIFCNAGVLILIESILYRKHIRYGMFVASISILMIVIASIYGDARRKEIKNLTGKALKTKIGIIQGNFSGLDKKDRNKFNEMIYTYNDLSKKILVKSPDLIVWPESAIPTFYDNEMKDFSFIKDFDEVPLLFGTHIIETKKNKEDVYNSLVLLSADGQKINQYYKHKLLAFVEGMPFKFLNFIMYIYELSEFSEGKEYKIMDIGKIKMATNICYEDVIPGFIRNSVNIRGKEANLIVNGTNDSWFGKTIEPFMHLRIAGFRAIENRKTLIRATCTGYSGIFDPSGNLIYVSTLGAKDSTINEVPLLEIKSTYRQGGWLFVYFLGLVILIIFIYAIIRKIQFYFIKSNMIAEHHHKKNALSNLDRIIF